MRLTPLSLQLWLSAAVLSFVFIPELEVEVEAEVFQNQIEDSEDALGVVTYLFDEKATMPRISSPVDTAQEVITNDWIKITRRPPKHSSSANAKDDSDDQPLPVVIWHGLGDSADAKGLKEVAELLDEVNPGTYTYMISLAGSAGSADRQASFFGNVTEQVDSVCHMLANDNILRTAPAVDALGFSQGGLFLRGYVERCTDWAPKVRSLVTFGSPHNGIAEFQKCASATDWICQGANALLKSSTVWSDFIQSRLVPAQYYRDTKDFDSYLEHSNYLADIDNERAFKNATYAKNLAQLARFVMIMFDGDKTLIPKETAWFAEWNETQNSLTPLPFRQIFQQDWIGLKKLDEQGGLRFVELSGEHMQFSAKDLKKLFGIYFGPARKSFDALEPFESAEQEEERLKLWRMAGYQDEQL